MKFIRSILGRLAGLLGLCQRRPVQGAAGAPTRALGPTVYDLDYARLMRGKRDPIVYSAPIANPATDGGANDVREAEASPQYEEVVFPNAINRGGGEAGYVAAIRTRDDFETVLAFFRDRPSPCRGYRFKDWSRG